MIGLLTTTTPTVYSFTLAQLQGTILAVAGGITAISAAIAVIVKAVKKAQEPDQKQNERIDAHDKKFEVLEQEYKKNQDETDRKLKNDKEILDMYRSKIIALEEHQKEQDFTIEDHSRKITGVEQRVNRSEHGINVMMKALLALLSHGIDGNAVEPMKEAKADLETYLINGQNTEGK